MSMDLYKEMCLLELNGSSNGGSAFTDAKVAAVGVSELANKVDDMLEYGDEAQSNIDILEEQIEDFESEREQQ